MRDKTGGREKGTPNKITKDLRTAITDFLNSNIDEIQLNFNQLEPKEKLYFMERLFKYLIPVMSDNSFNRTSINNIQVDTIFTTDDNQPIYNLPNDFKGADSIYIEEDFIIRVNKPQNQ